MNVEIVKKVEEKGIILNKDFEGRYDSILGEGGFGRFYVITDENNNIFGMKEIRNNPKQFEYEIEIQMELTKERKEKSNLNIMPILDFIKERNEDGELISIHIIMPLAALGDIDNLRYFLNRLEDKYIKDLLIMIVAKDLLLGIFIYFRFLLN